MKQIEHISGNEPVLRFPEFVGEWEKKKLGEVSTNIMYGMNAAAKEFDGINKYLRITDIDESSRSFVPNPLCSPNGDLDDKYLLKENDIVFTRTGASTGKSYIYNRHDGNLFFAGFLIKFEIKYANPQFIFLTTLQSNFNKWVVLMSMRSGQPGINAEEYKQYSVYVPTLPEQQKIADFLTVVDKKLSLLRKKKKGLDQYKKGLMQQIFSQEIRFKPDNSTSIDTNDGSEYPDWEVKKLGEVAELSSSKRVYLSEYTYDGIPFYRGKEISEIKIGIEPKDILFISKDVYDEYKSKYGVPQVNDILMTAVGTLGNVLRIRDESPFYFKDGNLIWFRKISECSNFLEYLFEYYKSDIEKSAIGSSQKALTMVELRKLFFYFPSLPEQQKIAEFLTAIDVKIDKVETQIKKMADWKKGLMQRMFC